MPSPTETEVIPYTDKIEDWNRLIRCPKCGSNTDIDAKGNKYTCKKCGFSIDKPRCKKCHGIRLFVSNIVPRVEITFRCIDCKTPRTIELRK